MGWRLAGALRIEGMFGVVVGKGKNEGIDGDWGICGRYTIPASSSSGWSTSNGNAKNVLYKGDETNGAYYTWCLATAGTCVNSGEASSSICPKGWRLPSNAEYSTLLSSAGIGNNSAGSTKIRGTPYNFPYAGYVSDGSLNGVGSYGYYWSRTAYNSDRAYSLYFASGNVNTGNGGRYNGFSVRCIAP